MSRMPPTESSDMYCLNREEGETISLDYQDLYGVQVMHKLPSYSYSDHGGYGGQAWCGVDDVHHGDGIHYADNTLANKEYTDLSNKTDIEHSLEFIRSAIEVNTIPADHREIIEQSIYNLQAAMDISKDVVSDKVIHTQVNTTQYVAESSAANYSDLLPPFVRTEYQPRIDSEDSGKDRRCSVIKRTDTVSPISVEEDRVRQALGLPPQASLVDLSLGNISNISLQPDWSSFSSAQENLFPSPWISSKPLSPASDTKSLSHSLNSPNISMDNNPARSSTPSPFHDRPFASQENTDLTNPASHSPGSDLVPCRIRKIGDGNDSDQSHRLTRDEKAAKNMNIPYSVQVIINCSMEEFNDILNNKSLDNEQISLCRNIRRRGKNKIAAQNCRKRKIDEISELEEELLSVKSRKRNLLEELEKLMLDRRKWMVLLDKLEKHIIERLVMDQNKEWELRVTCQGLVQVVERAVTIAGDLGTLSPGNLK